MFYDKILDCIPRITNSLEGQNRNIKEIVEVFNPNTINLIITLKKEQMIAEKRMLEKVSYFEIILVNEKEQTLLEICKIMINIKN